MTTSGASLPLRCATPDAWAPSALRDPLALLNDHAHLERKAATNALELLHRWPDPCPPEHWVSMMTAVARDEVEHLATVTRLLARRGGRLTKHHRNQYAMELRAHVRLGEGARELADRLLVSALIEARSCERFEILSRFSPDDELTTLYRDLWTSEHGHYLVFLKLAREVDVGPEVDARWSELLDEESEIIRMQPAGPRMHGWTAG